MADAQRSGRCGSNPVEVQVLSSAPILPPPRADNKWPTSSVLDLLEDELNAIMQAGGYRSREDTMVHTLEVLLAANPQLRVSTAIELYRKSAVTLSRAVEISGLETESFKDKLAEMDVSLRADELPEEIRVGAELIGHLRQVP
jgi:predicted HTH domain antitoxin